MVFALSNSYLASVTYGSVAFVPNKLLGGSYGSRQSTLASSDSLASAGEALKLIKPKLRGWIHAITAPLALAACIVLTVLAPTATLKIGSGVYLACSLLLFANSGVYHISNGHFPAKVSQLLRRIDHANIYLLIAGTYTPLLGANDAGSPASVLALSGRAP